MTMWGLNFIAGFGRSSKAEEGEIHRPPFQAAEAHLQRRILQENQEDQEAVVAQRPSLLQASQSGASGRRRPLLNPPHIEPNLHHREQERRLHTLQEARWGRGCPVFQSPGAECGGIPPDFCGGDANLLGHVMTDLSFCFKEIFLAFLCNLFWLDLFISSWECHSLFICREELLFKKIKRKEEEECDCNIVLIGNAI